MNSKWTNNILAAIFFAGLGLGRTGLAALEITVIVDGVATNETSITAPTDMIDLSAIVTNNTGTVTFQWCTVDTQEPALQNQTNRYEVVFDDPSSSNTVAFFQFAGTYLLSVIASDPASSTTGTVLVTYGLNPTGVFQNVANFVRSTTPNPIFNPNQFLSVLANDAVTADAYYRTIDPCDSNTTLNAWKLANDIPTNDIPPFITNFNGNVVSATYFNAADLAFGRRMIMGGTNGRRAFAVTNYRTVDEAISNINPIATVAMEYSPGLTNDGIGCVETGVPFTKFYVFVPTNQPATDQVRTNNADLDGGGAKFVPGLCIACHGGNPAQLTGNTVANSGNISAHFLPFDLRNFDYSCTDTNGTREAQEPAFKSLNQGVLDIERAFKVNDPGFNSNNVKAALIDLIEGWYGGTNLPNEFQCSDYVPTNQVGNLSWQDATKTNLDLTGQAYLYLNVFAPSCRGCHLTRNTVFGSFAFFDLFKSSIQSDVFNRDITPNQIEPISASRQMPHARRTFERFWLSTFPRPQPEILREYLLGILTNVCSYSISPSSTNFPSSGGTGSFSITTPDGCAWSAASSNDFIQIISCSYGSGGRLDDVIYSVEANTNATQRTGTIIFGIGPTNLVFTVTQQPGGNQPPVAICQDVVTAAGPRCRARVHRRQADDGSFDPDGRIVRRILTPAPPYPLGTTVVTLTVVDDQGASSSCSARVTVRDQTPPGIVCPFDITVTLPAGELSTVVNFRAPSARDNCSETVVECSPASGASFTIGNTTVVCTATDAASNQSSCSFTITVTVSEGDDDDDEDDGDDDRDDHPRHDDE